MENKEVIIEGKELATILVAGIAVKRPEMLLVKGDVITVRFEMKRKWVGPDRVWAVVKIVEGQE